MYGAVAAAVFGAAVGVFSEPILKLAGAKQSSLEYAKGYLFYSVALGAVPTVLTAIFTNLVRSEGASLQASIGAMLGCIINIALDPLFVLPFGLIWARRARARQRPFPTPPVSSISRRWSASGANGGGRYSRSTRGCLHPARRMPGRC